MVFGMCAIVFLGYLGGCLLGNKSCVRQYTNLYEEWKEKYVVTVSDSVSRVSDPDQEGITVSEGIGYGMLFAVMYDDQPTFDALFAYAKKYESNHGFMHWKISKEGEVTGSGGAADAEEDIAYSLFLAHKKWKGEVYLTECLSRIGNLQTYMINKENRILPGDEWGNTDSFNPSYVAPEYYLAFYEVTKDSKWLEILKENVNYMQQSMNQQTGLFPNWMNFETENHAIFGYESVRVPIRFYQFLKNRSNHMEDKQQDTYEAINVIAEKEAQFASRLSYDDFMAEYQLDGTNHKEYQSNAYLASGLAMLLAYGIEDRQWITSLKNRESEGYYGDSLRLWCLSLYDNLDVISN